MRLLCDAASERRVVTASIDFIFRLYATGEGCAMYCVLEGLHSNTFAMVARDGEDMLVSASDDETVAHASLRDANAIVPSRQVSNWQVRGARERLWD